VLREAMERLLTDHELRERFRANCDRVKRELSWEEPLREQERIYEAVLAENRPS
jgi:glycosyltransferase involved in cell wall biosynthesis